ncbi:hypothetical protein BH10BAC2_BH10BAC2_34650 [soil metagenome]
MKTLYRTAFWADADREELVDKLKDYNIDLVPNKFEVVEFYDNEKDFSSIKAVFDLHNIYLDSYSIYTEEEFIKSKVLGMVGDWHYGYPQPENDYEDLCYDLTDYCKECGIGAKQVKPLRITGEPKWGRRQIFQLNWIFDEYFVKPEIYNEVFKPIEIGIEKFSLIKKYSSTIGIAT